MPAPPPPTAFYRRYGISRTGKREAPLEIEPYPQICRHTALRATVVASAVDIVGSLYAREVAGSDPLFTTDLSVRVPPRGAPARITARGRLLRAGRSVVTSSVTLEAAGAIFAYGESSFRRMLRDPVETRGVRELALPETIDPVPLERPLCEEVGIEVIDASVGHVEAPLRNALRNPEGVMQGALVALLAEVAADTLAEHALPARRIVTELDLRYLAAGRVGPIATRADWIGAPDRGMMRVELRDRGASERVTAAALLRVEAAPP